MTQPCLCMWTKSKVTREPSLFTLASSRQSSPSRGHSSPSKTYYWHAEGFSVTQIYHKHLSQNARWCMSALHWCEINNMHMYTSRHSSRIWLPSGALASQMLSKCEWLTPVDRIHYAYKSLLLQLLDVAKWINFEYDQHVNNEVRKIGIKSTCSCGHWPLTESALCAPMWGGSVDGFLQVCLWTETLCKISSQYWLCVFTLFLTERWSPLPGLMGQRLDWWI